jgi:prevent-host-death family protein
MERVSIRELNQQTSKVLARVKTGEVIGVTEHGRVIATIAPVSTGSPTLDRLIAEGRATPAIGTNEEMLEIAREMREAAPDDGFNATEELLRMRDEDPR